MFFNIYNYMFFLFLCVTYVAKNVGADIILTFSSPGLIKYSNYDVSCESFCRMATSTLTKGEG